MPPYFGLPNRVYVNGSTSSQYLRYLTAQNIETTMATISTKPISIQDLKNQAPLWYKIHVFVYDLRNFQDNSKARARLDAIQDPSYIGMPYFDPIEVQQLKACIVDATDNKTLETLIKDTLKERLERRNKKRVESGDYRICAAHDLAPIFETAFNIKTKDLQTNTEFLAILDRSQLKLKDGDNWKGLQKKSFQSKNKHKKHWKVRISLFFRNYQG